MLVNSSSSSPPPGEQHARSPSRQRRYKGVRRRKWGRWVSEIRLPNSRERIWLGSYDTPEKAARAFDAAFVCLRGPGAADGLNFPDSPPAVGRTSDAQEVYAAAVSHANRAATAPREEATDPTPVHDDVPMESLAVATMPTRLEVETFDWSQLMANPPPLFSPTVVASHAHLPVSPTGVDMEEDESGAYPGLWSFDSDGSCSRH
ncbi:ethylene-responsive transcription factor ERF018-like [Phragmites australis]|uniref:ethylene-responsive transcription factor ERF018-like n=1 Tax=Phragmites australis TaxID=29695 RepID=UPI002D7A2C8F|nr:ethylene-responsive transcription factor ERF018-like [Phragmites australis]